MPRRFQFNLVDPSVMAISPAAIGAMPATVARHENVVPVSLVGGILTIAVEDTTDSELLEKLRFICNRQIEPVAASPNAIRCAVTRYYGHDVG
ncbi:MAG: hypothetical protein ACREHD_02260 [Pirellulales bacterium]